MNIVFATDFYKFSHRNQYPQDTEVVYSTWTPRSNKHLPFVDKVVVFGFQSFIWEFLIEGFQEFFSGDWNTIEREYVSIVKNCLGVAIPDRGHLRDLYELGHLPIEIRALPEGSVVPLRTPILTVHNTDPRFFWIPNYLETLFSTELWKPTTTASIARKFRNLGEEYGGSTAPETYKDLLDYQFHDFSMRGMGGLHDAANSGMGHLLYFKGTDTVPAIQKAVEYYFASHSIGASVPATEHSVMCAGTKEDETETFRRIIEDVHPSGIVSLVSDTWDLWKVLTEILPELKEKVLARDGKVVIRPDSGDPVDIICGDERAEIGSPQNKGVMQLLWEVFGGSVNSEGFKELNPKIGAIYGDSITLDIATRIFNRLKHEGFASTGIVLGIGSYTYQYQTRDSLGFAMKATLVRRAGKDHHIFKDPITDDGTKKSLRGAVRVFEGLVTDGHDLDEALEGPSDLRPIFRDGDLLVTETFHQIRARCQL